MDHRSSLTRLVAGMLCTVQLLGACSSWQVQSTPLPIYLAKKMPAAVRVSINGGGEARITAPRVLGDSVVGSVGPAVALVDVKGYEVRRLDPVNSIGLLAIVYGGIYLGLQALDPHPDPTSAF